MKNLTDTINHVRHFADNPDIMESYWNAKFDRSLDFSLYMSRIFLSRADRIGMTASEIHEAGQKISEAWMQSAKIGFYRAIHY